MLRPPAPSGSALRALLSALALRRRRAVTAGVRATTLKERADAPWTAVDSRNMVQERLSALSVMGFLRLPARLVPWWRRPSFRQAIAFL